MAPKNNIQVPVQQAQAVDYITFKNTITNTVLKKIGELQKGGITMPKGYSANNQIMLAFLQLSSMTDKRTGQPILTNVSPQSVANALLSMCIKGLSLEKHQCAFIKYGNELQLQQQYQGTVALAKRCGAGEPQAQVIYQDDVFEFTINPHTGKKEVLKHEQKLANIDNAKIIGAWCLVPYAESPELEPKVEVMTLDEIKTAWMQGATKGQSDAHLRFTQEMCKKTVIGRACKQFVQTSSDAGIYDEEYDNAEFQAQQEAPAQVPLQDSDFGALPPVKEGTIGQELDGTAEPAPVPVSAEPEGQVFDDAMFDPDFKG